GGMLTTGFVVGGTEPRRALIRAIGPTLAQWVINPMANPRVAVFSGQTQVAANDDWSDLAAIFSAVGAFALPEGSKDAAVLVSLPPGSYTAQVTGDGPGEVIVEVYLVD